MLLDGLEQTALVGTDGVVGPHPGRFVDRGVAHVAVAPPVAGALALAMKVGPGAVGGDPVDDLGDLVMLGHDGEEHPPAAVAGGRHRVAEAEPREEGREAIPALEHGLVVRARVGPDVHPLQGIDREIGQEVVDHHPPALAHLRVVRPDAQVEHRDQVLADVVGAVVLALPDGGGEVHPVQEPRPRLRGNLGGTLAVEPAVPRLARPQLGHQQHRGVVHHPVVLRVPPQRMVGAPRLPQRRLRRRGQLVAPEVGDAGGGKHPEHIPRGRAEHLDQPRGDAGRVLAQREAGREVGEPGGGQRGLRRAPTHRLVAPCQVRLAPEISLGLRPPGGHRAHMRGLGRRAAGPRGQEGEQEEAGERALHWAGRGRNPKANTVALPKDSGRHVRPRSSEAYTSSWNGAA